MEGAEEDKTCEHCKANCCLAIEMQTMLLSLRKCYGRRSDNKKVRFKMYSDAVKYIHGPGLGKGVHKKLPDCVSRFIRRLATDEKYTGYVESASCKNK